MVDKKAKEYHQSIQITQSSNQVINQSVSAFCGNNIHTHLNRCQNRSYIVRRTPAILQDIQADSAVSVDIRMEPNRRICIHCTARRKNSTCSYCVKQQHVKDIHFRHKTNGGRFVRIFFGKFQY